mmetsp:Transcript_8203/g.17962  ORF Transcript_8203/g.17962 Transcript_8203/m.17962 type:complete len:318 (+) Transcript_8203:41-994(+)
MMTTPLSKCASPIASKPVIRQRQPSIFMLLGAILSGLWFFAVPPLQKSCWESLFSNLDATVAEMVVWAIPFPYFLIYCTFAALPVYYLRSPFLDQYKISREEWPWFSDSDAVHADFRRISMRAFVQDMTAFCLFLPLLALARAFFFPSRNMSFSLDDWPNYWELAMDNLRLALLHEFLFYWTHRMMHSFPGLYKYHKVHHEFKQNNVLSAQYFHPVDFFLSIGIPAVITTAIVKPHACTQIHFGLWLLSANFDDHLGYAFPWTPFRWFPFSAGTDAHEFHHSVNMGCYSSKLSLWDWIFGTDKIYNNWHKKRWGVIE